jgi:hypothetical protein
VWLCVCAGIEEFVLLLGCIARMDAMRGMHDEVYELGPT